MGNDNLSVQYWIRSEVILRLIISGCMTTPSILPPQWSLLEFYFQRSRKKSLNGSQKRLFCVRRWSHIEYKICTYSFLENYTNTVLKTPAIGGWQLNHMKVKESNECFQNVRNMIRPLQMLLTMAAQGGMWLQRLLSASPMWCWRAQSCSGHVQVPQLLWAHGYSNIHVPSRRQISALPLLPLTFFPPPLPNENIFQLWSQSHGHHVLPHFHYCLLNIFVWKFDSLKFSLFLRHAM